MGEPRNRDTSRRPARVVPHAAARVCVAEIGAAHGIAGEVRLRAFTEDPLAVTKYGKLRAEDGRAIAITSLRPGKDCLIARLAGVADRTAAERLRNVKLYVAREKLPAIDEPETWYYADLVGLAAVGPDETPLGSVVAVQNFGAGDLLEIAPVAGGPTLLLPFTDAVVPEVDVANGRVVVNLPVESKAPLVMPRESGAPSKRRPRNARGTVVTGSSAFADDDG
jgi:16S rRNA processing protein RimM